MCRLVKVDNISENEMMMLGEKGTVIIYADGSIKSAANTEYRTGKGMVIMYRKNKKFGVKFVAECEFKKKKDSISDVEYKALKRGLKEAKSTWGFSKAYVLSDSIVALGRLKKKLEKGWHPPFDLELFWVEGHKKILLNETADFLATSTNLENFARTDEALVIPSGEPYVLYNHLTKDVGGIKRAYFKGQEREEAFRNMMKLNFNLTQ